MNKVTAIAYHFFLVSALISFTACENHVEEITDINEEKVCDPTISFSQTIKGIIDQNCTGCHGGSQPPDLRSYTGVKNNAERIKAEVTSRRMPQGGSLTTEEIDQIRCWIESGALDN